MASTVVEQEDEVVCWMHHFEEVNDILKLEHHVVVCPISFAVLNVLKEEKERRLVLDKWSFVQASKDLDGCLRISIM